MPIPKLVGSKNMLAEICSMLPGCFVIHKFALVSRKFREAAKVLGPFNDSRVIWMKLDTQKSVFENFSVTTIKTLFSFSNTVGFCQNGKNLKEVGYLLNVFAEA